MKNIEKIKEMDSAKLADFLVESGAEVPADFCDIVCLADSCKECKFCGVAGIREAWKTWLESEYDWEEKEDDQESQEQETIQSNEQDTPEQGSSKKKKDEQGVEGDIGSGPAGGRMH